MPVQCTCSTCGTPFPRSASRVQERNYCSSDCFHGRNTNVVEIDPSGITARVPLCSHDGTVRAYAIIDAADAQWVAQWKWSLNDAGYAVRAERIRGIVQHFRLHRELLGLPIGDERDGDHIDLDRLNCRRYNLRIVPKGGNAQNRPSNPGSTSLYRGVSWDRRRGKWRARVGANGQEYWLGHFTNEREAADAASEARKRLLPYAVE